MDRSDSDVIEILSELNPSERTQLFDFMGSFGTSGDSYRHCESDPDRAFNPSVFDEQTLK
jgi:hypothetical protein